MTTRWKLTIEYDGRGYIGWQRQEDGTKTIQAEIESAIEKFSNQKNVRLHVAGRTDAGVHAFGQIAHVDLEEFSQEMDGYAVMKAINAYLRPQPISVLKAEIVDDKFHARFGAKNKLYKYRIINRPGFLGLDRGRAWHFKRALNVPAMQEAAQYLRGHHDFTSFRAAECQGKSPEKTVTRADVEVRDYDSCGGREIIFYFEAQSFLHHQVRNMVGTLTLVGEDKWQPIDVKTALEARDRKAGGPTAAADGLYLVNIDYL